MVNLLDGIWMEDGIQRQLQVQVSGALPKPKCLGLSCSRMRCDLLEFLKPTFFLGGEGGGPISARRRTSSFLHYSSGLESEISRKLIGRDDPTTRPPRSSHHTPPAIFFWRYTEVAAYGPPPSTTLPELPGRIRASTVTVTPVMPTELRTELEYGYDRAGPLTVPSLNMCKLLSEGHKNIIITITTTTTTTTTTYPTKARSSFLCHLPLKQYYN